MRIKIAELIKHEVYHETVRAGKLSQDGSAIEIDDEIGKKFLSGIQAIEDHPNKTRREGSYHIVRPNAVAKTVAANARLLKWIGRRRKPGEIGVGDTLERLLNRTGSGRLVIWIKALTGIDCKCHNSKEWLNHKFPYEVICHTDNKKDG